MMENYSNLTKIIYENKAQIELIQWAIISGVSALIYPEYLKNIKTKQVPVPVVLLPKVSLVRDRVTEIAKWMVSNLREQIDRTWYDGVHEDLPDFSLFKDTDLDIIIERYISPNMISTIPSIISKKFDIDNQSQQAMREDRELTLFDDKPLEDYHKAYLVDTIIANLLLTGPSINKTSTEIPVGDGAVLSADQILTISNPTSICPIHINQCIALNPFIGTLAFVTMSNINMTDNGEVMIKTSDSNTAVVTKFHCTGGS